MSKKLNNFFMTTKKLLEKYSPEILTGIGITGLLSTTILAVKATPKALELINKEENAKNEYLTNLEKVKVAWKPYIPSALLAIGSISCIIGASRVNYKRNAALATAYALSESTLVRYRDKVVETLGERKEKEIKTKVDQDVVNENKASDKSIIVTSNGNSLCMDALSGRYFRSSIDSIKKSINKLNRDLTYDHYISLNQFYGEIGLSNVKNGELMGWNLDNGLLDPEFSTCLAENDEPCIVIDFMIAPKYDFDKLM